MRDLVHSHRPSNNGQGTCKKKKSHEGNRLLGKELNLNATDWLLNYINNITEYDY